MRKAGLPATKEENGMGLFTSNNSAKKRQEEIDAQRVRQGKLDTKTTKFSADTLFTNLHTSDLDALLTTFAPDFVAMLIRTANNSRDAAVETEKIQDNQEKIIKSLDSLNANI